MRGQRVAVGHGALLFGILLVTVFFILRPAPISPFYTVVYGEIVQSFEGESIFIRHEEIYNSPATGKVTLLVPEEERVRGGTPVIRLETERGVQTFYAPYTGVISFKFDGWEEKLRPETIGLLDQNLFDTVSMRAESLVEGQRVEAGGKLFRMVDNFSLYLLVRVSPAANIPFPGQRTRVSFPLTGDIYWSRVLQVDERNGLLLLQMDSFVEEFLWLRSQPVKLIRGIYQGLVVPRTALDQDGETTGVWVAGREGPRFRVVSIIGYNSEFAVVEGLRVGEDILKVPPA